MKYNIVVATCKNNGIGISNTIPWWSKEDLQHFSLITKGKGNNVVVMGRKTWESIPTNKKPLIGRDNIIISSSYDCPKCTVLHSFHETIAHLSSKVYDECWIIGGESIYNMFMNEGIVSQIIVTRINESHECDIFFPKIPENYILEKSESLNGTAHCIEYYTISSS